MSQLRMLGRLAVGLAVAASVPVTAASAATRAGSSVPAVASNSAQGGAGRAVASAHVFPIVSAVFVVGAATAFALWLSETSRGHINLPVSRG